MLNSKRILSMGFLFMGVVSNSLPKTDKEFHSPHKNCQHQQLQQILDILENQNPLCARWDDQKCLQCAARSYFNEKGICIQIDTLCKNFDDRKNICKQCYPGYQISKGKCIVTKSQQEENWTLQNPLCANWSNKKCVKCSPKSYFNSQKICIMANPDCKTFSDTNGYCLSCFDGYELSKDGKCFKTNTDNEKIRNPLCSSWGLNGLCKKCSPRSFKNKQGICQQIDPNCNTFNDQSGQCVTCYSGYNLKNGKCFMSSSSNSQSNPYCSKWDKNICISCSDRSYLGNNGICTPVNTNCKSYSQSNGQCTSCYQGFQLVKGNCLEDTSKSLKFQQNPLCTQWVGKKCSKCSTRSYLNKDQICIMVDPNCRNYNQKNGDCTSCFPGYGLDGGKCIISKVINTQNNPLCGKWSNEKCIKCSPRSYFDENGICVEIDPNCKTFSQQKRICEKCYVGYRLRNNRCILPGQSTPINAPRSKEYDDLYCSQWESPYKCKVCASGTYKSNQGKCIVYDLNCKFFNQIQKKCDQCYADFIEIGQRCTKFNENLLNFDIQKCISWRKGQCIQCAGGLIKNSQGLCNCP